MELDLVWATNGHQHHEAQHKVAAHRQEGERVEKEEEHGVTHPQQDVDGAKVPPLLYTPSKESMKTCRAWQLHLALLRHFWKQREG